MGSSKRPLPATTGAKPMHEHLRRSKRLGVMKQTSEVYRVQCDNWRSLFKGRELFRLVQSKAGVEDSSVILPGGGKKRPVAHNPEHRGFDEPRQRNLVASLDSFSHATLAAGSSLKSLLRRKLHPSHKNGKSEYDRSSTAGLNAGRACQISGCSSLRSGCGTRIPTGGPHSARPSASPSETEIAMRAQNLSELQGITAQGLH